MAEKQADQTAEEKAQAQAQAAAEAEQRKADETVPGGRYLVDGVLRDAHGNEITDAKKG